MKNFFFALALVSAGGAISQTPTPPNGKKWVTVDALTDEFTGNSINSDKWFDYHDNWKGRPPSAFKKGNAFVENGKLLLRSTMRRDPSTVNNPFKDVWVDAAACVSKENTAKPGYYYEARIKASSLSMTSSFWFRVGKFSEIDVIEHIGNPSRQSRQDDLPYQFHVNTHYNGKHKGLKPKHNSWKMPTRGRDDFNIYGFWWKNPKLLIFYFNGKEIMRLEPRVPFDENLKMVFDTEVFPFAQAGVANIGLPLPKNLKNNNMNTMYVDWVRTYELKDGIATPTTPTTPTPEEGSVNPIPGKVEAESFNNQTGIQSEPTTDNGGGQNIGFIQNGDNATYKVNVSAAGSYNVAFRVSSANTGGTIDILAKGSKIGEAKVASTGGWQTWTTVNTTVNLTAGAQDLKLNFKGGASGLYNINHFTFTSRNTNTTPTPPITGGNTLTIPGTIQAEDYTGQSGIQKENTTDIGSGQNIGYINNGDSANYAVNIKQAGSYTVQMRVASGSNGGEISVKSNGQTVGKVLIPGTGGWQNWQTVTMELPLKAGNQTLAFDYTGDSEYLFNINYMDFKTSSNTRDGNIIMRAKGVKGEEKIQLQIGGKTIETFTLTTNWADYSASASAQGTVRLVYANDIPGRDLEVDYISKNGIRYEAEDQKINTAAYQNGTCGGSYTQRMDCNGYMEFSTLGKKQSSIPELGDIIVSPNPASTSIQLQFIQGLNEQQANLAIYDALGRKVLSTEINSNNQEINVSNLPSGLYILDVWSNEKHARTQQLIISK